MPRQSFDEPAAARLKRRAFSRRRCRRLLRVRGLGI